jgi:hypothetical protein
VPAARVPNFAHDVHDLGALAEVHPYLFSLESKTP